ncbi:hypothetical protein HYPSUDRAFT_208825 [Hypholoma sublateritium FD-334 SS-4]|uniref:Uncharacterized protein n=1 Tax=Hypholoma sublateritium (strain FD-334 SS-4) TaxID=945553 RepID=A0A0D2N539_HYPSF|nr:hypothetical protein HYPSUDRAFT_208825 [Hypholoma sublateritium FD-334 SS-4]
MSASTTVDLNSSLHDAICNIWYGDFYLGDVFLLNADGTGEIGSSAELSLWIAQPLRWKLIEAHETIVEPPATLIENILSRPRPVTELVATIEIQIIAEKAKLSIYRNGTPDEYPDNLLDRAFLPNEFRVTIERGKFWAPRNGRPRDNMVEFVFDLRMTMDRSPFPPMELWKPGMQDVLEYMRPFDKRCFVAQRSETTERQGGCICM